MDTVILSEVMKHLDTNDLESFTEAVPESKEVSEDLHFKIQKAILDLEKEFGITTIVNNNSINNKYTYTSEYEKNIYKYGNNPYELLEYRRNLINGVIECNTIEVPISIYSSTADDFPDTEYDFDIDDVNNKVLNYVLDKNIKRGDLVHLQSYGGYREDGILMYDGYKIIIPDSGHLSEYFNIPDEFNVTIEFPPNYWNGTDLFSPSFKLIPNDREIGEIMDSFEYNSDEGYAISYFNRFNRRYRMIFWFDMDVEDLNTDGVKEIVTDYLSTNTHFEGSVYETNLESNSFTIFAAVRDDDDRN